MKPVVSCTIEGMDILIQALRELGGPKTRAALRQGFRKAGSLFSKEAKSQIKSLKAVDTGMLYRSIGFRVYTNRHGNVGCVIGPRRDKDITTEAQGKMTFSRRASWRRRAETKNAALKKISPAKYAHLVEYGHAIAKHKTGALPRLIGKRTGGLSRARKIGTGTGAIAGHVAPKPFLRNAWANKRGAAMAAIEGTLAKALEDKQFKSFDKGVGIIEGE